LHFFQDLQNLDLSVPSLKFANDDSISDISNRTWNETTSMVSNATYVLTNSNKDVEFKNDDSISHISNWTWNGTTSMVSNASYVLVNDVSEAHISSITKTKKPNIMRSVISCLFGCFGVRRNKSQAKLSTSIFYV